MIGAVLTREQFLSWLGGDIDAFSKTSPVSISLKLPARSVALIWEAEADLRVGTAPLVMIPSGGSIEFYAFVTTYVSTYVPFSAYFRVVEQSSAKILFESEDSSNVIRREIFAGVIIGEAISQSEGKVDSLAELSVSACLATLSYPLAQAAISGNENLFDEIAENWNTTRRVLGSDTSPISSSVILDFWKKLAQSFGRYPPREKNKKDYDLRYTIFSIISDREVSDSSWATLSNLYPDLVNISREMRGSREIRARSFSKYLDNSFNSTVDKQQDVVIGLLASQLAGGSFEYVQVVTHLLDVFPAAGLWFGLFSASMKASDVLSTGNGLGRRIHRKLNFVARPFDQPICDIAFDEFTMLSIDKNTRNDIRTDGQLSIVIELAPTIAGVFRKKSSRPSTDLGNSDLNPKVLAEARFLIERLAGMLAELDHSSKQQKLFTRSPVRQKNSKI